MNAQPAIRGGPDPVPERVNLYQVLGAG